MYVPIVSNMYVCAKNMRHFNKIMMIKENKGHRVKFDIQVHELVDHVRARRKYNKS